MIRFAYTILYVHDVPKILAFYEVVFALSRRFLTPDDDYGELSTGATILSFAHHTLASSHFTVQYEKSDVGKSPLGFELGFTTDDVQTLYDKALANGATPVAPPTQKSWGQIVSYIRDPEGYLIEICTPAN
jgi:uncharacterized glyoxalase superfamily protein PhnB